MTVVSEVQTLLGGTSTAFWGIPQICDALNEAQLELYPQLQVTHVIATLTVAANDDLVALPSTVMLPKYILGSYGKYFPTTQAKLEQFSREWKGSTPGQVRHFVLWDASTLRLYPKPNDTQIFEVGGTPWPTTELSTDTLDITENTSIKSILAHKAAARLLEFTQPALSEAMEAEAASLIHSYKISLRNRGGHRIYRLRPGTAFTLAQRGGITQGRNFS